MIRMIILFAVISAALSGCGALGGQPQPTALPFNLYTPQDALDAFTAAGLDVITPVREMQVQRGAPSSFSDRFTFVITGVEPGGGQVLSFATPEALNEWLAYIETLRADSATRRDVSYTYTYGNIWIQVNANLVPNVAGAYEAALATMRY